MSASMTQVEREAFLAQPRVAILSIAEAGRGPLAVPVWYLYEPGGEVRFWTSGASRKARLLLLAGRASLVVQNPQPPYQYVSVEGPITRIEPAQFERDLRSLAQRYLGAAAGERYLETIGGPSAGDGDLLVHLTPEHWVAQHVTLD
jgi:PPOX class probable F420-dependent enzyme